MILKIIVIKKLGGTESEEMKKGVTPTAWKMSVFGVILVCIFPAFRLYTEESSVSLHNQSKCGDADQNNSEYGGQFLRSVIKTFYCFYCIENSSVLLTYIITVKLTKGASYLMDTSRYSCVKLSKLANIITS